MYWRNVVGKRIMTQEPVSESRFVAAARWWVVRNGYMAPEEAARSDFQGLAGMVDRYHFRGRRGLLDVLALERPPYRVEELLKALT